MTCTTDCNGNWEGVYGFTGHINSIYGLIGIRCADKIFYCDGSPSKPADSAPKCDPNTWPGNYPWTGTGSGTETPDPEEPDPDDGTGGSGSGDSGSGDDGGAGDDSGSGSGDSGSGGSGSGDSGTTPPDPTVPPTKRRLL